MSLSNAIVTLIRDEVGDDSDFADNTVDQIAGQLGSLEAIYGDQNRGNGDILRTALVVWRKRRAAYTSRGFDVSDSGSLMNRSQRMKILNQKVLEYEMLVDTTHRHVQSQVISPNVRDVDSAEFS